MDVYIDSKPCKFVSPGRRQKSINFSLMKRRRDFSAGPNGEANGLFGVLESVPEPSSMVLGLIGMGLLAGWRTWKNRRTVTA
jgi:MYXO-CTERM domain-containing protein